MIRKIIFEILIIVCTAVLLAFMVNRMRPDGLALFSPGSSAGPSEQLVLGEISMTEAINRFHAGSALFVDAREAPDFNAGHIRGAINLTAANMDSWIDRFLADTAPDTLIIAYCDGVNCSLGRDMAEQFRLLGYEKAYYLKDGWRQWKQQRMPTGAID
jgi:rhodanese-related sulfurtransferase